MASSASTAQDPKTGECRWATAAACHDYLDALCAGAAAYLYQQPDSDWFNLSLAEYHQRTFREAIREATRFRLEASPVATFRNPTRTREFF